MPFIRLIGVELEGAWEATPSGGGGSRHDDASVDIDNDEDDEGNTEFEFVGEFVSAPSSLEGIVEFLENHYPDKSNASCGFHIHISVTSPLRYQQLMSEAFHEDFKRWARKWAESVKLPRTHTFWERLAGRNHYCEDKFHADEQVCLKQHEQPRYTHLNYAWGCHGTLECRLMPMFRDLPIAISCVKNYVAFVEEWLGEQPRSESWLDEAVDLSEIDLEDKDSGTWTEELEVPEFKQKQVIEVEGPLLVRI